MKRISLIILLTVVLFSKVYGQDTIIVGWQAWHVTIDPIIDSEEFDKYLAEMMVSEEWVVITRLHGFDLDLYNNCVRLLKREHIQPNDQYVFHISHVDERDGRKYKVLVRYDDRRRESDKWLLRPK